MNVDFIEFTHEIVKVGIYIYTGGKILRCILNNLFLTENYSFNF